MKFPHWAPPDLVRVWNERDQPDEMPERKDEFDINLLVPVINRNLGDEAFSMLERLLTDQRMEKVWRRLAIRDERRGISDARTGVMTYVMAQAGVSGWKLRPQQTPLEKRDTLRKIQRMAAELALALNRSHYLEMVDVSLLMNDDEVLDFARNAKCRMPDDTEKALDWLRCDPLTYIPPMEILLTRLTMLAEHELIRTEYVKQPGDPDARIHYFVRFMAEHFIRCYGSPLYDILARITSVVLDTTVDVPRVRELVRGLDFRDDHPMQPVYPRSHTDRDTA